MRGFRLRVHWTADQLLHGQSLIARATVTLGMGAIGRIGIIALLSWLGAEGGWLGPRAAAAILLSGFLLETAVARWAVRRRGRQDGLPTA